MATEESANFGYSHVVDEDAAFIAMIAERQKQNEFPLVPKEEQEGIPMENAAEILTWVQKEEYVKIQSFMASKYAEHRETAYVDDGTPEAVFHARWARIAYYPLLQEYYKTLSQTTPCVEVIQLMLGENKLVGDELLTLQRLLANVPVADNVTDLESFVETEFEGFLVKQFGNKMLTPELRNFARSNWLSKHYVDVVDGYVQRKRTTIRK